MTDTLESGSFSTFEEIEPAFAAAIDAVAPVDSMLLKLTAEAVAYSEETTDWWAENGVEWYEDLCGEEAESGGSEPNLQSASTHTAVHTASARMTTVPGTVPEACEEPANAPSRAAAASILPFVSLFRSSSQVEFADALEFGISAMFADIEWWTGLDVEGGLDPGDDGRLEHAGKRKGNAGTTAAAEFRDEVKDEVEDLAIDVSTTAGRKLRRRATMRIAAYAVRFLANPAVTTALASAIGAST